MKNNKQQPRSEMKEKAQDKTDNKNENTSLLKDGIRYDYTDSSDFQI